MDNIIINDSINCELTEILNNLCSDIVNDDLQIPIYSPLKYNKKILVVAGGGIRGMYYIGALHSLYEMGFFNSFETYAGASIGALLLFLINIGFIPSEMLEYVKKINLSKLKSINLVNFFDTFGVDSGIKIISLIKKLMSIKKIKHNITFKELYDMTNKKLIVSVTNLNKKCAEYLSYETHPNLQVIQAIRMSISIPFLFEPVVFNGDYYIDGGCIDNFPIELFKNEKDKLIGIYSIPHNITTRREISSIYEYVEQAIHSIYFGFYINYSHQDYDLIKIPNDLNINNFDITNDEKITMFNFGCKIAYDFLHPEK